jgi:cytoskeletal protein CcmA (bactofilin family)
MARVRERGDEGHPSIISIIGPGMRVLGDCATAGTIRIEGSVEGEVFAGKAIVVGKEGVVTGDLRTQDAVIAGQVHGAIVAASRLEVQATARIQGQIHARRMQLEEGALLNGEVQMGEIDLETPEGVGGTR